MQDNLPESPVVETLRQSLENERTACSDFLFSVTDEVLTPQQEALCEVLSYPWHMDFLELCHILTGRHNVSTVRASLARQSSRLELC